MLNKIKFLKANQQYMKKESAIYDKHLTTAVL